MTTHTIALIGGSGFVGQRLASRLARDGHIIRVLTRRRERHREALVLPKAEVVEVDVHDQQALDQALAGCDVVINLVGILNEKGNDGKGFAHAHVELPRKIISACRANSISRLLHMSALHADASTGSSHYLRSKGAGEELVHAAPGLSVTSFRPSVIFGPGDSFFNRFATLMRLSMVLPLACSWARFAPVFVGDVAEAFARAVDDPRTFGQRYELCGPQSYTLQELVNYTAEVCGMNRLILPMSESMSWLQARVMEWLPGKPFSRDNYNSTKQDSTCSGPFPEIFGITPASIEMVVPGYLSDTSARRRYQTLRQKAQRD